MIQNSCNYKIYNWIKEDYAVDAPDLISSIKLIKTKVEMQGFRDSHIRDGATLVKFFAWLENELLNYNSKITEFEAGEQLLKFKEGFPLYKGPSFNPIVASGGNGSIIHYKAKNGDWSLIDKNKMLLWDSGGQYLDGTTDTTRTLHFGKPTEFEKQAYTRVLRGNLDLETVAFPRRINYSYKELEVLARK